MLSLFFTVFLLFEAYSGAKVLPFFELTKFFRLFFQKIFFYTPQQKNREHFRIPDFFIYLLP